MIIPPHWKERVFIAGAIATLLLRVIRDNQSVVKKSVTTETPPQPIE
jgi:hypothetical protein